MSLLIHLSADSKIILKIETSHEKLVNSHLVQPGTQHHFTFVSAMMAFPHVSWLEPTYISVQLISQQHLKENVLISFKARIGLSNCRVRVGAIYRIFQGCEIGS